MHLLRMQFINPYPARRLNGQDDLMIPQDDVFHIKDQNLPNVPSIMLDAVADSSDIS